ncbi:MAG TPA: hypothetical protein VKA53_05660 [Thermoanaerobaculia bacterium]|nr:hypothetical protein [Thermoanaerobaculia bacterium]
MTSRSAILALALTLVISLPARAVDPLALHLGVARSALPKALIEGDRGLVPLGGGRALARGLELDGVYERQRGILRFDQENRLESIDVQIIPDEESDGREVLRLYAEIRSRLLRRLGSPSWEQAEGDPHRPDLLAALSNGEVTRYLEWDGTKSIRMGIPLRADGAVLIELEISARPSPREQLAWGSDGL